MSCSSSPSSYIMTPDSDVDSPLPVTALVQGQCPRSIIRHLLNNYTKEQILHALEEESTPNTAGSDPPSIKNYASCAAGAQLKHDELGCMRPPENPPGTFVYSPPIDGVACKTEPFDHQEVAFPGSGLGSWRTMSTLKTFPRARRHSLTERPPSIPSMSQRVEYPCGFCAEENIRKTCTRRNDLRRHIQNFHNKNAVWFCQHPGCKMAYDWPSAYLTHLRNAHGRSHMNVDEAMVNMCPQTVFACGFDGCTQVFEARSAADAENSLKQYSAHIVKHYEDGCRVPWTYSTRLRNLLRQSQTSAFWDKAWLAIGRPNLQWDTQTTMAARRTLEAGHVENLGFLTQVLVSLGTQSVEASDFESKMIPPIRERCLTHGQHSLSSGVSEQNARRESERDTAQFEIAGGSSLTLGAYSDMSPQYQQVPRSIEPYSIDQAIEGRQDLGQYVHRPVVSMSPVSPAEAFFNGTGQALFTQSSAMLPTRAAPCQHAAGHFVAVAQSPDPSVSPAGFHGMQPASMSGGINVDLTGGDVHAGPVATPSAREDWFTHYSHPQLTMQSASSAGGCHVMPPEHGQMTEHFGNSPRGSI